MGDRMVICNACGWVHFAVSPAYVDKWKSEWEGYFATWPKEKLAVYGVTDKPPSDALYYHCERCGGPYTDMRDAKEDEVPRGSTIGPVLDYTSRSDKP